MKKSVAGARGQIAIFVALIFQVLFVLFAMVINVALIVHDKINLQNAVDLAAYYAAQRQAEMLNVIAHQNYMIRQSWKLLAWRSRVLATMGYASVPTHPARINDFSETESPAGGLSPFNSPLTCVSWDAWEETPGDESVCQKRELEIVPLPIVPVIAGFFPINASINALSINLKLSADQRCAQAGAFNWWYSAAIFHAFRIDQINRKEVIYALANNLTKETDFVDLNGDSVERGAFQTLRKNLTFTNENSEGGVQFEMFNSLKGLAIEQWLSEIQITPVLRYMDYDNADGCKAVSRPVNDVTNMLPSARTHALGPDGEVGRKIRDITVNGVGILQDKKLNFALGFEKNPWIMPYMGVRAATRPRQIFAPFGPAITLQARAFAKPFGGRIGPWYGQKWQRGSTRSDPVPKLDVLTPERISPNSFIEDDQSPLRMPNYSRFPGDLLGMASKLAQVAMLNYERHQCSPNPLLCKNTLSFSDYRNITAEFINGPNQPNDILPWRDRDNTIPPVREYEIAAIAPDLFDITYYSIEPNYTVNYLDKIRQNRNKLGIPSGLALRGDLGSRGGVAQFEKFSVQDQILRATELGLRRKEAFYFVREPTHLLTSWVPGVEAFKDYPETPPMDKFGQCVTSDKDMKVKVPGSCVAGGGRTGYSIKLVSRDMLVNGVLDDLGGRGLSGAILNPPTREPGW